MLPTKGYFQDIECPYLHTSCGRPYCHFRHRRKQVDQVEEIVTQPEKDTSAVPTYKPTPKSQLASIHSSKSHIPISYVPDLAFRPERKARPFPKFEKPTYKPTPLSILSSASKNRIPLLDENEEHVDAIKEIKQNIANVEYDPTTSLQTASDIDFEDLSTEFDLIDEIINSSDKSKTESKFVIDNNAYDPSKPVIENSNDENNESELHLEYQQKFNASSSTTTVPVKEKTEEKQSNDEEVNINELRKHSKTKSNKEHHNSSKNSINEDKVTSKERTSSKEKSDIAPNKSSKRKNKHTNQSKSREHEKQKEKKLEDKQKEDSKYKTRDKDNKSGKESRDEKIKNKKSTHESKDKLKHKEKHRHKEKTDSYERKKDKEKKHIPEKKEKKHSDREKSSNKERHHKSRDEEHTKPKSSSQSSGSHRKDESRSKHRNESKTTKYSINENEISDDNDDHLMNISNLEADSDLEDEDETMMECYRIFNEYKPPLSKSEEDSPEKSEDVVSSSSDIYIPENVAKKRIAHPNSLRSQMYKETIPPIQPKIISTAGQSLANRYKLAKLAQANREQELLMNEMNQSVSLKRPAPSLLDAARALKKRRELENNQKQAQSTSLVDDILQGNSKNTQPKMPKKIAPAQNVMLMAKSKERISRIKPLAPVKTIAQTQKSGRVAHIPDVSLTDIPDVLEADKSKLPVNVRTRFLTMIADECVKLYISKDEAFTRALNEEYSCYEKCKVLATYRNSAMLAVNRLRKEIQERNKSGLGLIGIGEDADRDSSSQYKGQQFYNQIKKWILTEEELDIHGYPRESEKHHGKAVIRNFKKQISLNLDDNQRMCCRCHKLYQVDDDGWPLFEEECCYHPLKKRTIRGEQTYLCCRSSDESGCATSDTHVSETANSGELDGFQTTMDPEYDNDSRNYAIYALDCEMCYTTKGLELTRVTIVDTECKTVYESLVKPFNPIIDYNTRFSGITKEQMDKTSTSILQVQANILHLCNSKTILVGHSLESDMKALKIVHENIIDTAVLFPHKMGLPHKRALKALASEYLRKIIQNDISGHDSAEDAITCMELLKWKLKDELKLKGS